MRCFWKIVIVSDVFKVMRSSFQTLGAATGKAPGVLFFPLHTDNDDDDNDNDGDDEGDKWL